MHLQLCAHTNMWVCTPFVYTMGHNFCMIHQILIIFVMKKVM
jgi:hypothetical protein